MWHFNVTKDLNALIKVSTDNSYFKLHVLSITQYVQQSHPNWQNGIHLPFQYSKTELLLELKVAVYPFL